MKARNLLALPIAALLALSFGQSGFAASAPFTDLNNVAAKDKIIALQEKGYVHGVDGSRYMPEANMTAAQGIQLIVNTLNLQADPEKAGGTAPHVDPDEWYADVLQIAAQNGIELPLDFHPDKALTREEFIYQLMIAMETQHRLPMIKIAPVEFADSSELTVEYQGAIQRAIVLGIVQLDADRKLHPKGELTRADAAELIYHALEFLQAHPGPAGQTPQS
jgi:hypothetical protein